jgi:hypothetical protein
MVQNQVVLLYKSETLCLSECNEESYNLSVNDGGKIPHMRSE